MKLLYVSSKNLCLLLAALPLPSWKMLLRHGIILDTKCILAKGGQHDREFFNAMLTNRLYKDALTRNGEKLELFLQNFQE